MVPVVTSLTSTTERTIIFGTFSIDITVISYVCTFNVYTCGSSITVVDTGTTFIIDNDSLSLYQRSATPLLFDFFSVLGVIGCWVLFYFSVLGVIRCYFVFRCWVLPISALYVTPSSVEPVPQEQLYAPTLFVKTAPSEQSSMSD